MIKGLALLAICASVLINGAFLIGTSTIVYSILRKGETDVTDASTNAVLRTRFKKGDVIAMESEPVGAAFIFNFRKEGKPCLFSWSRLKDENVILIDSGEEQVTFFDPLDEAHAHNRLRLLLRRNGSARPALFAVDGTGRFMPVRQCSSGKLVEGRQDKK